MPMGNQNGSSRNLKGLWLLPILALGLGVLVSSWKKPASRQPTAFEAARQASQTKQDAYNQAKYHLVSQLMQGQPKGYSVIGFAPYQDGTVTGLGPARYLCSSFLTVRAQTGEVQEENWQCVITRDQNNWTCEEFRHAPPERTRSNRAKQNAKVARKK